MFTGALSAGELTTWEGSPDPCLIFDVIAVLLALVVAIQPPFVGRGGRKNGLLGRGASVIRSNSAAIRPPFDGGWVGDARSGAIATVHTPRASGS